MTVSTEELIRIARGDKAASAKSDGPSNEELIRIARGQPEQFGQLDNPTGEITTDDPSLLENVGRAAAKGASELVTFPAEALLGLLKGGAFIAGAENPEVGGIPLSDINPTQVLQDAMRSFGVRTDADPDTFGERALTNTVEALSSGFTGLGLARTTTGAAGKALKNRFGKFAAEEVAIGTAGAQARTFAEEAGFGRGAAGVSELATNLLGGAVVSRARALKDTWGKLKDEAGEFSRKEFNDASKFFQGPLREHGEDPLEVARQLRENDTPGFEHLTSAQRADSIALRSMERALVRSDNEVFDRFVQSKLPIRQFIQQELRLALGGEGVSQDFLDWYMDSSHYASDLMEKLRQRAIDDAWEEMRDLPPGDFDFSTPLRSRMEALRDSDRKTERELWSFAKDAQVRLTDEGGLKAVYDDIMSEAGMVDKAGNLSKFPGPHIRGTIEQMAEEGTASVDELLKLRSAILDDAAEASASGQRNLARRLNALGEGVLDTMGRVRADDPEVLDAVNQARQYSRDVNDRWSRDTIGGLMAESARRGPKVADNETLEKLFKPGELGRTNMRALNRAMGGAPNEARQYVLQRFMREVVDGVHFDVGKAESFVKKYRPTLEETGTLEIVSANIIAGRKMAAVDEELAKFGAEQAMSIAAQVLKRGSTGNDLSAFIQGAVLGKARNLQQELLEMFATAKTDLSGDALTGVKGATVDAIMAAMHTAGGDVSARLPQLRVRILDALNSTGEFTPEQVNRVNQMLDIAYRSGATERVQAFKGQSTTAQDLADMNIMGTMMKFIGLTKVAPALTQGAGPGKLAAASLIGRLSEALGRAITENDARSLIRQAPFNHELMIALLENPNAMTPRGKSAIVRALKAIPGVVGRTFTRSFRPSAAGARFEQQEEEQNGR